MKDGLPGSIAVLLFVALMSGACDRTDLTIRGASGTAPDGVVLLTAEPAKIVPDFLPTPFCRVRPPFGARVRLTLRAGHDLIMRAPRFELVGTFGERFGPVAIGSFFDGTPSVNPGSLPGGFPESSPVPMPQASPVPLPGSLGLDGLNVSAGGFRVFPLFVQFGCGVPAFGTLFVSIDTTDRRGALHTSRTSVQVGS